jgi:hypothetical protein
MRRSRRKGEKKRAGMDVLHGWKKAGELKRTLEEEVDISQQDSESLERNLMDEGGKQ